MICYLIFIPQLHDAFPVCFISCVFDFLCVSFPVCFLCVALDGIKLTA